MGAKLLFLYCIQDAMDGSQAANVGHLWTEQNSIIQYFARMDIPGQIGDDRFRRG